MLSGKVERERLSGILSEGMLKAAGLNRAAEREASMRAGSI